MGARKIHVELAKLDIEVSLATVSRYFPKRPPDAIAAMDFFVVPTARFQLLYVWFVAIPEVRGLHHRYGWRVA